MVVYADIFFVINFSMDLLCLYLTSLILRRRIKMRRAVLASALGALYSVIMLFFPHANTYLVTAAGAVAGLLLCLLTFGFGSFSSFLRPCLLFLLISFLLGGGMTFVYGLLNIYCDSQTVPNASPGKRAPLWLALLAAAISALCAYLFGRLAVPKKRDAVVSIEFRGRLGSAEGLVDSGNLLVDPVGRLPVIFVSARILSELLLIPANGLCAQALPSLPEDIRPRVRLIPFRSVGGSGIVIAFLPDRVTVNGMPRKALIACGDAASYGGMDALVPAPLTL